jgi:hypothetical protein
VSNTSSLTGEAYTRSAKSLLNNIAPEGLMAASPNDKESKSKNYTSLFSRDIGVSALGILTSGDDKLIKALETSLDTLAKSQSKLGQLPFHVRPEEGLIQWWMPGTIDGTIWWGIALLLHYQQTKNKAYFDKYQEHLEKAFTWLTYQDTNNDYLLEQGEASDWADEMPRFGAVLYTNALWYWFVKLRIQVEKRNDLKPTLEKIYEAANTLLWVHKLNDQAINYFPDNEYTRIHPFANNMIEYTNTIAVYLPYYLGFMSHKSFEMRCDVYSNTLACLVGLADEKKQQLITDFILRSGSNQPYPVKALYPPIYPGEEDWRQYMMKGRQNYPWQYHNGGIWPYIGGFWVALLAQKDKNLAKAELENLAKANSLNNWEFNEYLHGQLGTPMGIPYQTWNMTMYMYAYNAVEKGINFFK